MRARLLQLWTLLAVSVSLAGCDFPQIQMASPAVAPAKTAVQPAAQSPLLADRLVYDAGQVLSGDSIAHEFVFRNTSPEPLSILEDSDIRRTCGCTSLAPDTRLLPPGATAKIAVSFDTTAQEGPLSHGGSIIWTTAGGQKREVHLSLSVESLPPFRAEPRFMVFTGAESSQRTHAVELKPVRGVEIDWNSVTIDPPASEFTISARQPRPNGYRFDLSYAPAFDSSPYSGSLLARAKIKSLSGGRKPLDREAIVALQLRAEPHPPIRVRPASLLARFSGPSPAKIRLLLTGNEITPSQEDIRAVTYADQPVDWSAQPAGRSSLFLDVSLPAAAPAQPEARLRLFTSRDREIAIPVLRVEMNPSDKVTSDFRP